MNYIFCPVFLFYYYYYYAIILFYYYHYFNINTEAFQTTSAFLLTFSVTINVISVNKIKKNDN